MQGPATQAAAVKRPVLVVRVGMAIQAGAIVVQEGLPRGHTLEAIRDSHAQTLGVGEASLAGCSRAGRAAGAAGMQVIVLAFCMHASCDTADDFRVHLHLLPVLLAVALHSLAEGKVSASVQ